MRAVGLQTLRRLLSLRRPSARDNARALRERRESLDDLTLRDAVPADVPALAALHVATWNDTYAPLMTGPPVAVREQQWRQAFAAPDGWFCFVVVRADDTLVGFAKGVFRPDHEIPGELNKLFLARDYQRVGLGRRLMSMVAEDFLRAGVTTMAAHVDPRNPSCGFFERMGGRWLVEPNGRLNLTWYVWDDLRALGGVATQE